jgi:hypothetical protein
MDVERDQKLFQHLSLQDIVYGVHVQRKYVIQIIQIIVMLRHQVFELSTIHNTVQEKEERKNKVLELFQKEEEEEEEEEEEAEEEEEEEEDNRERITLV